MENGKYVTSDDESDIDDVTDDAATDDLAPGSPPLLFPGEIGMVKGAENVSRSR